jgi:hypothetical protein
MRYKSELICILSKTKLLGIALRVYQKYHVMKTYLRNTGTEQIAIFRPKANFRTILIDVSSIVETDHGYRYSAITGSYS